MIDKDKLAEMAKLVSETTDISVNGNTILAFGNCGDNQVHLSNRAFAEAFKGCGVMAKPLSGIDSYEVYAMHNGTRFFSIVADHKLDSFLTKLKQ